jgi:hypothetical protein
MSGTPPVQGVPNHTVSCSWLNFNNRRGVLTASHLTEFVSKNQAGNAGLFR